MSLELYSLIPGQQVKRDRDLSNVTIQCDPLAVYPDNRTAAGVAAAGNRFKPGEAGKLAVEDEICDLTINGNLEVKGKLKLNGGIAAEICNISCPEDFNLDVGNNANITSHNNINLLANGPGLGDITLSTVGSTDGDILASADGGISLTSTNLLSLLSTTDNIVVDAGGNTTINSGTSNVIVNAGSNQTVAGSNNLFVAAGTSILMTADTGDVEINAPLGTATISGTTATQVGAAAGRLGFYGVNPPVPQQVPAAITAATFAANTSGITNDSATYTVGANAYTVGEIVAALAALGLIA